MSRWIRLDCEYFDHDFFADEPFTEREAFQWIIIKAAWKDTTHRVGNDVVSVSRGSFFCTQREMAKQWSWGTTKVRNFLDLLTSQNMIVTTTEHKKTLVSVCNYSKFQDKQNINETKKDQEQNNSKTTAKQEQNTKGTNNTIIPISSSLHSEDIIGLPEEPDNSKIEIDQAFEAYNLAAKENDWAVCQKISKARNSQMKARLKDCGGIDGFMACLEKCKASDFLQGRVGGANGTFQLGIDFILRDSSFTKIMEGNYDNRAKVPTFQSKPSEFDMLDDLADKIEARGVIQ